MTDTDKTYNGWTNYETWNLALWLDNDQGSQEYWQERTQEAYDEAEHGGNQFVGSRMDRARIILADWLKDETEEQAPDLGASFYADMLNAALSEINYYEIARHWLDDAELTEDETEEDEVSS